MAYYIYGDKWKNHNPSPEVIDKAIDELLPIKDDFVVLVNTEPHHNCEYVQTLITRDNAPKIKNTSSKLDSFMKIIFAITKDSQRIWKK